MQNDAFEKTYPGWRALHADTKPWAESIQFRFFREAPAWRKLELAADLTNGMLLLAESGIRDRYPAAQESEVKRRLADMLLGPELARRVYGPPVSSGGNSEDATNT